jgi:hypothetical protein
MQVQFKAEQRATRPRHDHTHYNPAVTTREEFLEARYLVCYRSARNKLPDGSKADDCLFSLFVNPAGFNEFEEAYRTTCHAFTPINRRIALRWWQLGRNQESRVIA